MTVRAAGSEPTGRRIQAVDWNVFRHEWFPAHVEPGHHVAYVAPTGYGKTTFWVPLLSKRKWVLAFDPKGGSETLKKARLPRLESWPPPRRVMRDIEDGKPARFIVGPIVHRVEDFPLMAQLFRRVLREVFALGGFTVYVDELQVLADRRMMGLAGEAETLLIAAREKGVSVWTSFQRPANVPGSATDQATWFVAGRTRDRRVIERLAEMAGRPVEEMRGLLGGMDAHTVAVFGTDPFEPVIVTRAPPL